MSQEVSTHREEHLQKLAPFCRALVEALTGSGLKPEKAPEAFQAGLTAECVRCGIHLSGEELFALSQPPSDQYASVKIGRLRLGDCAREGCQSYFYRLTFRNSPSLDWPKLIAQAEAIQHARGEETAQRVTAQEHLRRALHSSLLRRAALALAVAMMLLLARQWYLGGRIPFVREPEHFRIATASPGEEQHGDEQHGGDEAP